MAFLNDILKPIGIQMVHVYYVLEENKNMLHLQVAIQQVGNIPHQLMGEKNNIVSQRKKSLPYEDWEMVIMKTNGYIDLIAIGIHNSIMDVFRPIYRIEPKYHKNGWELKSIKIESDDDLFYIHLNHP